MSKTVVNVAVIGVGLVGKEFLNQLATVASNSPNKTIRLIYVSNSSKSTYDFENGIRLDAWADALSQSSGPSISPSDLPERLKQDLGALNATRSVTVTVDNTSSDKIAALYPSFLKNGIDVITPNKKAYSSSLTLYSEIIAASSGPGGGRFLNESTVGAGLPIISTLKDLVATGDEVVKIEGVLSGTLSYIFNEYSTPSGQGPSFSSIVTQAREKGYTEPHPGDDLNGADVARKLTILSRLIPSLNKHLPEGYQSVSITSLVPTELASITSGDEFVAGLPKFDDRYEKLRESAKEEGMVLRYVGVIDVQQGVVKAALEKYPANHAFATSLQGSDNIIAFHTKRYGARPLIVQGAGAGAAVTAMGVMSDLLKLL